MSKHLTLSLVAGLLLSACATSQAGFTSTGVSLSSVTVPNNWETTPANMSTKIEGRMSAEQMGWLTRFDDASLMSLVETAYANNPNLKRLQARLDRARALSDRAKSALLPSVDGAIGASRMDGFEGADKSSATLNAGLNISWEADIWGRNKNTFKANQLRAEASQSDINAARQILAAAVVENYVLAIEAKRLAEVSNNNLEALNKTLGFVTVQYERGLRAGQDISLIRADVASAKVSYNRAEGAAREALRALGILLGVYPNTNRLLESGLPSLPTLDVVGQPADLLTHRPDLQAAQFRVEAAYAAHKASRAAQKPNLSLGGLIGGTSSSVGQLFDPSALASTLFANLTAPIFDGGARKADIAIAQSDVDEALANYQEMALDAFRDVETQIDQGQILAQQEKELMQALSDAREALKFIQFRYESAEADLLNVLSVQQRVSFIEGQLVSTRRARLVQYVNLALALGGEPDA